MAAKCLRVVKATHRCTDMVTAPAGAWARISSWYEIKLTYKRVWKRSLIPFICKCWIAKLICQSNKWLALVNQELKHIEHTLNTVVDAIKYICHVLNPIVDALKYICHVSCREGDAPWKSKESKRRWGCDAEHSFGTCAEVKNTKA